MPFPTMTAPQKAFPNVLVAELWKNWLDSILPVWGLLRQMAAEDIPSILEAKLFEMIELVIRNVPQESQNRTLAIEYSSEKMKLNSAFRFLIETSVALEKKMVPYA